jgi:hypothetical protein
VSSALARPYFRTFVTRKKGWMTLTLKGKGNPGGQASLKIESNLPGFTEIATRAAWAAKENKLMVDRVTADNLAALGVSA